MKDITISKVKNGINEYEAKNTFIHTKRFLLTHLDIQPHTFNTWKKCKNKERREIYLLITQRAAKYQMEALNRLQALKGKSEKASMQWAIERYYREDLTVDPTTPTTEDNKLQKVVISIDKSRMPDE